MKKGYGWMGTILRVDLSQGTIEKEPLSEDLAHNFVGGRGINSKILYDETGPGTEPLSPENRLIIGTGPAIGTLGPSAGRFTVTAKSPLTGILGDGNGGGDFGPELKFAGYDHIVIQGKAEKPVYLWINDGEVIIKDARHLWGKSTWEAEEIIRQELGDKDIRTLCIGQAGENLVRFACTVGSGYGTPGRTGTGGVMGSKNLKAIAVRGSQSVKVADPEKYMEIVRKWYSDIRRHPFYPTLSGIGMSYLMKWGNQSFTLPVRNAQATHWPEEEFSQYHGENFSPRHKVRDWSCFACPTHCKKFSLVKEGAYAGEKGMQSEGMSLGALGPLIGSGDYPFTLKATNLCNEYGLDTVSAGAAIAVAMEWFQRGIITTEDTDGLELTWGNREVIIELLRKIATREGFGNILAEGAAKAARKIGKGAEKYEHEGPKGMSMTPERNLHLDTVLCYSMNTRGYEILRGHLIAVPKDSSGKAMNAMSYDPLWAEVAIGRHQMFTAADLLEICKFNIDWMMFGAGFGVERMAELLSAITGVDFSEERLRQASDRVSDIEKAYIAREGMRREHDNPPGDYFERPQLDGPDKGWLLDREKFEGLKDRYYELKGWDKKTGVPAREELERVGLEYVADEMEKMGVY